MLWLYIAYHRTTSSLTVVEYLVSHAKALSLELCFFYVGCSAFRKLPICDYFTRMPDNRCKVSPCAIVVLGATP